MSKTKKGKGSNILLPGLEEFESQAIGNVDNDESLEAELLELLGGGGGVTPKKTVRNKKEEIKPIAIEKNLLNLELTENVFSIFCKMNSMDHNDGDIDENDPELLAELNSFLNEEVEEKKVQTKNVNSSESLENIKKLEDLKQLYQEAIKQSDDTSKSRRYERSLKQINELLQKARNGQSVNESDFPPRVHINAKVPKVIETKSNLEPAEKSNIEPPMKSPKIQSEKNEAIYLQKSSNPINPIPVSPKNKVLTALLQRQSEYRAAAIAAKSNDIELAKGLMIVLKQFDSVITAVKSGEPFDLEELPPPPSEFKLSDLNATDDLEPENEPPPPLPATAGIKSLEEELKSRRVFYSDSLSKAKAEENDSKIRRMGRVLQQYDEALNALQKKLPYNYEELPPPPGRQPLPASQPNSMTVTNKQSPMQPQQTHPKPVPTSHSKSTKALIARQAEFRAAALKAKRDGDLPLAKELLRQSKGFDKMIEASESGLPVNLSGLPTLPNENDSDLVGYELCEIPDEMKVGGTVTKETVWKQLQATLLEQIQICTKYQTNAEKIGDIMGSKRFESLRKSCEKDLQAVKSLPTVQSKSSQSDNWIIPKFHYEMKEFSIVQANPDLGETEMELEVVRGINLALPSGFSADQLDTYVVLELPFPSDAHQHHTTDTVRRTNNPVFNAVTKFEINLKSRVFQRVVRSKPLKADIFYKKGFLQRDKLLGSSVVKLEKLETQCTIHESLDITENRKIIGGKLELKIRIRSPLASVIGGGGGNSTETVREKWLVIEDFNSNTTDDKFIPNISAAVAPNAELCSSIEVLKFEIGDLKKKLATPKINPTQANLIKQKIIDKDSVIRKLEQKSKSSNPTERMSYLQSISKLPLEFNNEAKKYLSENNRDQAQISITKKKIVEKEIAMLK